MAEYGTLRVKTGLAEMLKGGVIMDVVDAEQARIAEESGACAVMALERVPADIRRDGGVARMSDPETRAKAIVEATTHFDDPKVLADVSAGLGEPMVGISSSSLAEDERLEVRGW